MKLEEILDEEALKKFVSERSTDIIEAQNKAVAKLKKKKEKKLSADQDDSDALEEANLWFRAFKFLKKTSAELLMPMVLFDKNITSDAYKTPEATPKQRALLQFAADERISTAIQTFREQYPNWKKAKKQLMPKKMQLNGGLEINMEQSGVVDKGEVSQKPPKKLKKKVKVALGSESTSMPEEKKVDNEDGKLPKKKKKKSKIVKDTLGEETEKENFLSSDTKAKPATKKLNAIEQVVAIGTEALKAASPGKDGSPKKADQPVKRKGPSHPPPVGKKPKVKKLKKDNTNDSENNGFANGENDEGASSGYPRQGNGFQSRHQGRGGKTNQYNRRSGENGNGNRSLPPWKIMRYVDRNSSNVIEVSPDWQNKMIKPKGDDEEKPSLLRPAWLTNPEEYKPSFQGRNNFRKQWEPLNANDIPVPSDWKKKCVKEEDGGETPSTDTGTSLLKPSWLTNPEEHKYTPTQKRFRGNFRGKRKY